jgi:hypothetical protein
LERAYHGTLMMALRFINQARRPFINQLARTPLGRTALLGGLRAMPGRATAVEALTMKGGFADQTGFWSTLWNALMMDVPTGLEVIDCPVIMAQGALDVVGSGQALRYTALVPGARFVCSQLLGTPRSLIALRPSRPSSATLPNALTLADQRFYRPHKRDRVRCPTGLASASRRRLALWDHIVKDIDVGAIA